MEENILEGIIIDFYYIFNRYRIYGVNYDFKFVGMIPNDITKDDRIYLESLFNKELKPQLMVLFNTNDYDICKLIYHNIKYNYNITINEISKY